VLDVSCAEARDYTHLAAKSGNDLRQSQG
jgi:hypothetical protein